MTQGVDIPPWWVLSIKAQMLPMPDPSTSQSCPSYGRQAGGALPGDTPTFPRAKIHQER